MYHRLELPFPHNLGGVKKTPTTWFIFCFFLQDLRPLYAGRCHYFSKSTAPPEVGDCSGVPSLATAQKKQKVQVDWTDWQTHCFSGLWEPAFLAFSNEPSSHKQQRRRPLCVRLRHCHQRWMGYQREALYDSGSSLTELLAWCLIF